MENNMREYIKTQKKMGTSIKEIIQQAEIGATSFFEIARGKQIPKIDTAAKIAKALNAKVDEIFPILKGE